MWEKVTEFARRGIISLIDDTGALTVRGVYRNAALLCEGSSP